MPSRMFPFNIEKSINTILYISEKVQRPDFHKVFKILYFSDRKHLHEYGYPITGDSYIAMEAGPVPSKIYDICKIIRGDSSNSDIENLKQFFVVENRMLIRPNKTADLKRLSPNEKEILDECIVEYGDMSYDEIKEKSHDYAWKSTARDSQIEIDNIALESGLGAMEVSYIHEMRSLKNKLCYNG